MKTLKMMVSIFLLALLVFAIWLAADVIKARIDTPEIVNNVLSKNMALPLSGLTDFQKKALLSVEDPAFYTHKGIDLKTPGAGITTITQGLVKILYFKDFKPGLAKLRQTFIARFVLDPLVKKDVQLTLFINIIYLGNIDGRLVCGFEDAAQAYYKKPFKKLNKDEYLSIIAMIISPKAFNIRGNPEGNAERVKRIKKLISGEYKPKGLMDVYYGPLSQKEINLGLAPASYYPGIYK